MQNTLHCYVRDRKNNPIGVVVAIKIGDKYHCGWSLTKIKSGDKFDKETGMSMALGRAVAGNLPKNATIPHAIVKPFKKMFVRANKYFKCDPA